tara:strand:+ start:1441 stop:2112 length:672 start_codon:yes stop_codon:yes gene_type:complete
MKFIRKNRENLLIESFKEAFEKIAVKKQQNKKRLSFVLTGGPSPIKLYKRLSQLSIDWKNVDFFWGDERFVPKNSKYSNYLLAKKNLLDLININKNQIYPVNTKKNTSFESSKHYGKKIRNYFKKNKIEFDIVLLGMGYDGHIASVFPGDLDIKSNNITRHVIREDFERISISLKTINNSRSIFLWLNSKKRTKIFFKLKNKKKRQIPVSYLNNSKTTIFTLK